MFWPSRLENIDEVLRYARLSGYLYIRSVWNLSFFVPIAALLSEAFKTNEYGLLVYIAMDPTSWGTTYFRWCWCGWLASSICCSARAVCVLLSQIYRFEPTRVNTVVWHCWSRAAPKLCARRWKDKIRVLPVEPSRLEVWMLQYLRNSGWFMGESTEKRLQIAGWCCWWGWDDEDEGVAK